ncbi:MAG: recombinase family protein [Sulfuricurvum sp.]|uniref:recombinase family protein n=1 Tax=Sulfuricurvum sp. TaxID=2025608 RepID=UPI0026309E43|nr:recombinase family protein [Sulfuricurvum sp.]MDD2838472.1 recombinase family protein [Sulfuricurvum sp.]MDD3595397.1 recombinase family protein [Sulfuricurvum sp.]MDD4884683.1 recombinase family protein [Sulfuricurvum sp.]
MIVSYIRPDKDFDGVYEQLKLINGYADQKKIQIDEELVDQTSQSKRLSERHEVVRFFRSLNDDTLVIYDTWTLSSDIEDLVQMFSCLLKNGNTIHLVKPGVVIDRKSDTMVVLGLIDQLRQVLQDDAKKGIGRPKGSKSSSKFDIYLEEIIELLKKRKSVSEIARVLKVSRSSLKDYIESRELKEVVNGVIGVASDVDAEAMVIGTIRCPHSEISSKEMAV